MMNQFKYSLLLGAFLGLFNMVVTGQVRPPLNHSAYDAWNQIAHPVLSNSGLQVLYEVNPQEGDGLTVIRDLVAGTERIVERGRGAAFSPSERYVLCRIEPPFDTIRKAKLNKVKKKDMPKDSVWVLLREGGHKGMAGYRSWALPQENNPWMAVAVDMPEPVVREADTAVVDTIKQEPAAMKKEKSKKKKSKQKDEEFLLVVMNPVTGDSIAFVNVTHYAMSDGGNAVVFVQQRHDSIDSICVSVYDTRVLSHRLLWRGPGEAASISVDKAAEQLAWIATADTGKSKRYKGYYMKLTGIKPEVIGQGKTLGVPQGWSMSMNYTPWFSDSGSELYVATCPDPDPVVKDTLTEEEKVSVDVWTWHDNRLQPQQLKELDRDRKQSWTAVYHPSKRSLVQLATKEIPSVRTHRKLDGNYVLGFSNLNYEKLLSWEAGGWKDVYLINKNTGESQLLLAKEGSVVSMSPDEKALLYYHLQDSSWYGMDLKTKAVRRLTHNSITPYYNERHDVPSAAGPYGMAGWTKDGDAVVYDNYDLWALDATGKKAPRCLTGGKGRSSHTRFRYITLDKDEVVLNEKRWLLSAFDEQTKDAGFYALYQNEESGPQLLIMDAVRFNTPRKAKDADVLIWTKERMDTEPNLFVSTTGFKEITRLTDINPDHNGYAWGSVGLVSWTSFNGDSLSGLLYRPAGFNPDSSYPMIVYFYERYADDLHRYYMPKPIRSVINFSYYTSNGYVIFIPDIVYRTGLPGQSAYDCIISGTQVMTDRYPWIDEKHMGIQGQSWGGYQTAFLITRTHLFAAAMAGAPVSNMTSAYGGIRWASGMSRAFQYEQTQSRIGGTLWDDLPLYLENSPVFYADRMTTPLLIMHNDNDGAVPWYQGIELFNAMRRLNKPVWMLVYNGAPHNLKRRADCKDLTVRMQQFFDHFLKGAPEPLWMKKGVPALKKGKEFGFELAD